MSARDITGKRRNAVGAIPIGYFSIETGAD